MNNLDKASELFNLAEKAINEGKFEEALKKINLALEIDPNYVKAMSRLVYIHFKLGFKKKTVEEVFEIAKRALELDDQSEFTWKYMGDAYFFKEEFLQAIECYNKAIKINEKYLLASLNKGIAFYKIKEFKKAIECLKFVKEKNPNEKLVNLYLGHIYLDLLDYKLAVNYYSNELKMDNKSISALINLGNCYSNLKDYNKSLYYYLKAYDLKPNEPEILFSLGRVYYFLQNYDKSIEFLNKIIEIDEYKVKGLIYLGNIYHKKSHYNKSLDYYYKANDIEPGNFTILNNIGKVYNELYDYDKAIKNLEKAIKIDNNKNAWINLGISYGGKRDYAKSIECSKKALEIDPKDPYPYNNIGNSYFNLQNYTKASSSYLKAIELDEEYLIAYFNIGNLNFKLKKYSKAIEFYLKAIEIEPYHISTLNNLGNCYQEIGNFDKAIEWYNKILEKESNFFPALFNLGNTYFKQKEFKKALHNYRKVKKINPDYRFVWLNISNIYFCLKNYELALKNLKEFKGISSLFSTYYINLSAIYFAQGKIDKTIYICDKALDLYPNNQSLLINKTLALIKKQEYNNALLTISKLLRINSMNIKAHQIRGFLLASQKEYVEAIIEFEFLEKKLSQPLNYGIEEILQKINEITEIIRTTSKRRNFNNFIDDLYFLSEKYRYFREMIKSILFSYKKLFIEKELLYYLESIEILINRMLEALALKIYYEEKILDYQISIEEYEKIEISISIDYLNNIIQFIHKYMNRAKSDSYVQTYILKALKPVLNSINQCFKYLSDYLKSNFFKLIIEDVDPELQKDHFHPYAFDHEINIKIIKLEKMNWDNVRICIVQLDFEIDKKFPPKLAKKDEEKICKKVTKALELAISQSVNIVCFPELSFNENLITVAKKYQNIFVICGSYYDKNLYNTSIVVYNNEEYRVNKINPSPYVESNLIDGKSMNKGNEIIFFISEDKKNVFSILVCIDYYIESWRIFNIKHEEIKQIDFVFNPSYKDNLDKFQRCADADCERYKTDIIKISNADPKGGSYVFGQEHFKGIERLKIEKLRKDDHFKYKLCEILGEGILIFKIIKKSIEIPTPLETSHRIQEIQCFTYKNDNWEKIEHFE